MTTNGDDMLGHLSFGVADLPRAIAFYDAALAPLGYVRVWTTDRQAGYGPPGGGDKLALKLQSGPVVPPGPGFHLAFNAPNAAAVDAFHAAALRLGGTDAGAPGARPHYGPSYYAAFVRDPDGHKLEAVFQ
jgi:catechol 2,3-dioxygenase-like lactoylglutathione lyase family enzyme